MRNLLYLSLHWSKDHDQGQGQFVFVRITKSRFYRRISHNTLIVHEPLHEISWGAQWLSGRVLDSRPKGRGFEPHQRHCVVSLSKNINPSLVLVQPRKTHPFITERLLMGRKESNQTNKHEISNNVVCASSKVSDQPAHMPQCFQSRA